MSPSIEVLAIQAEQIRNQVHALKQHVGALHLSGDVDAVTWATCNSYLHGMETPIELVRLNLETVAKSAVAADPRA